MTQLVITRRTAFQQAISDRVRNGCRFYVTGVVPADRAASWARKAQCYYRVDLDRNARSRAKKAGEGCASLLMHESEPGFLTWILLVTGPAGAHPAHTLEKLRDAWGDDRIRLFGYELVRLTRWGRTGGKPASKPSWSWRMTCEDYESKREAVIDLVRRGDAPSLQRFVHSLFLTPGWAGCRKQVGSLCALMRAEAKRRGRGHLELPSKLYYVSRLRVETIPLNAWLSNIERRQKPPEVGQPNIGRTYQDHTCEGPLPTLVRDKPMHFQSKVDPVVSSLRSLGAPVLA